jgi:ABC-type transport system involved in multi-copper enzyme maturation permease subunit
VTEGSATVKRRRRRRREFNPLLIKELRGHMRGARAFVVLTVYLLLLSCFTSIVYYSYSAETSVPGGGPGMAYLGQGIFATVVLLEIFTVTAVTPAFTAGAISGERERKTYELLRTTLLPARRVISGKLAAASTYTLLLVLAALPLQGLAFVLGGVVVEELALALVILSVTAIAYAAIGLFFSSLVRTSRAATGLSYVTAFLTTVGLPLVLLVAAVALGPSIPSLGGPTRPWAVEAILTYALYIIAGLSPVTAAIFTRIALEEHDALWYFWMDVDATHRILIPSAWIVYTVAYLVLALVLLWLAVLRVRRQETR